MTTPDALRDAEYIADVSNISYDTDEDGTTSEQAHCAPGRAKEIQARVKTIFLNRLLRDLDILIYAQLSLLYYMDCSVFHFAIRAIVQLLFFSPKPGPFEPPNSQPYVLAILISNVACILLHYIAANPAAGDATRGYLHGGLFIDFVGKKGPVSKLELLAFDLVVVVLQIVMLGVVLEKERTKRSLPSDEPNSRSPAAAAEDTQDHDAEERGVRRSGELPDSDENDIELQEFQRRNSRPPATDERDNERSGLLSESPEETARNGHPRDIFTSGEAVIMDISILRVLQAGWSYAAPTGILGSASSTTARNPSAFIRHRIGLHARPPDS